ncbi:HepT-like ribonuclease domain-containing protein [Algoriphagus hitonicola]|uniref:Uncharacterized conserved protein, contains HEPN domain n=1 Tax=Algoriphagus hitonicola TaxID=435880 RepID=A0A1I2VSJ0_9BACT|nr:DUF86 domain-containing protein [Algoriphagus hitonicola]SFG92132.1 Uncharacterized conserved protein, contains HEPN domain [Algoriphagus hitonicola]
MKKDPVIYLEHISACISRIRIYTQDIDENSFLQNNLIQDAVIRNLEIIGEATKKLNENFRAKYPEIEWKKIAGMRDKLIHDYIGVDLWAVWGVVENIIPIFDSQIEKILLTEKGH